MDHEQSKTVPPVIHITVVHYDQLQHREYCKKFMAPLLKGILQRIDPSKK